jgi:hypothetical protein
MARSRRKNGGPQRGKFRLKKMNKGWSTFRHQPIPAKPIDRSKQAEAAEKQA